MKNPFSIFSSNFFLSLLSFLSASLPPSPPSPRTQVSPWMMRSWSTMIRLLSWATRPMSATLSGSPPLRYTRNTSLIYWWRTQQTTTTDAASKSLRTRTGITSLRVSILGMRFSAIFISLSLYIICISYNTPSSVLARTCIYARARGCKVPRGPNAYIPARTRRGGVIINL